MDDGLTLRETAARLGIAVATAFRWRHALLQSLLSADRSVLHGAVGFDNLWLPLNEKGRRDLDRPARTRGVANRFTYTGPSVRALLARDVDGTVCSHVAWIGRSLPMARDLIEAFGARVLPGTSVHSFLGPISQPARFARHVGGAFRMPDPPVHQPWARRRPPTARRSAVTGPWPGRVECVSVDCRRDRSPTFTVRLYAQLLRRWLMRFRGVATRYLLRYLVWHPIVDGDGGGGDASGANGGPPAGGEATQAAK